MTNDLTDAASAVQAAFDYAALYAIISLVVTTTGGIVMAWIGFKIRQLERNTNSIKDALVIATRIEGNVEGRAELKREQEEARRV